jgi:hypothetical protein
VKWGVFTSSGTETVPSGRVVHLLFGDQFTAVSGDLDRSGALFVYM